MPAVLVQAAMSVQPSTQHAIAMVLAATALNYQGEA